MHLNNIYIYIYIVKIFSYNVKVFKRTCKLCVFKTSYGSIFVIADSYTPFGLVQIIEIIKNPNLL